MAFLLSSLSSCISIPSKRTNQIAAGEFWGTLTSDETSTTYLKIEEIDEETYTQANGLNVIKDEVGEGYYSLQFSITDNFGNETSHDFINLADAYNGSNGTPISYRDDNGTWLSPITFLDDEASYYSVDLALEDGNCLYTYVYQEQPEDEDLSQYLGLDTTKGLDLFCYQENSKWKASLLSGTNSRKTAEEIDSLEGVSIKGIREVLSTYGGYEEYLTIYVVSRPCKWQELEGLTHINNIEGLNKIEETLGMTLTTEVGLYSLLSWVGEIEDRDISSVSYSTDLGSISPTFTNREKTYRSIDSASFSSFSYSLAHAKVSSSVSEPLAGGSGYSYRVEYADGSRSYLQTSNGYAVINGSRFYKLTSALALPEMSLYSENFVYSTEYAGTLYKDEVEIDLDTTFVSDMEFVYEDEQEMDPNYEGYELRLEDDEYLTFYDEDSFAIHSPDQETSFHKVINGIAFPFL